MVFHYRSNQGQVSQIPSDYHSGFSDLITSGNTGLQSQLDWSQQQYPSLWPSGGNYLGQRQYDDFLSELNQSPLFGGRTFQPLIFQGDLWKSRGVQGTRSESGYSIPQYHPYGMVPMGDAPEAAALTAGSQLTTDPNYFGLDASARRYLDPSTGNTFNVVRRGDVGYVYGDTPGESSLVVSDDTTPGAAGEDTTPGAAIVGEEPAAAIVGEEPAAAIVGEEPAAAIVGEEPAAAIVGEEPAAAVVGEGTVAGDTGLATTAGTTTPQTYQNLLGAWGLGQQGYGYNPGFNLPEAQYPVPGDRPTFSDYTNRQIIDSLRAEKNWSIPDATEGTYREREGWEVKSDQDILDYMAAQPGSWLADQQETYRPAALALMGQDDNLQNQFSQRTQVADIINMANQGFLGSMQMIQGYGQGAMQQVWKNYERNVGRGRAGLASRGMTGTTVYDAMKRGAGEQSMQDYLTAKDAVTGRQIQTYQQGIGGIVNALNSIQYRTMHPMEYAQLYQAFGEGGAGAAAPEAPSTTTNALLGTALGIATPLLLGSIFGPVGAGIGGLLGSAASTGSNILGGVGDLLEGAWDFFEDIWPF